MAMRRGTTDCITIEMPYKVSEVADGYVTITQLGNVIRDDRITGSTVILEDGRIYIPLSQSDTLAFPTGAIQLQVRMTLTNGDAVGSDRMYDTVNDVDRGGVIE